MARRDGRALRLSEQTDDLTRLGVTTRLRLLVDRHSVAEHLEPAAARPDQSNLGVRVLLADLGRQTGGAWLVVSDRAEFDRDRHDPVAEVRALHVCISGAGRECKAYADHRGGSGTPVIAASRAIVLSWRATTARSESS